MPLLRARCEACKQPLGDPPPVVVPMPCSACGARCEVRVTADGQAADFDASFTAVRLLQWFASARAQMARGAIGVAVGTCPRCSSAVVVSSREKVTLPCPHCATPVTGTAAAVLVDQWPEPWTRVEGGELSLEYRIAEIDDRSGVTAGCPGCGLATPANDPSRTCTRCRAVTWVERPGPPEDPTPRRVQLGVRIDGTRSARPYSVLVSLPEGEQLLRRDLMVGTSSESGSSLLGVTGIGCAVAVAITVVVGVAIAIAVHH